MAETTITKKGQVSIPKEIREKLGLKPGDRIEFIIENGKLVGIPVMLVPKEQAYFWTKEWQALEKSTEEDKRKGKIHEFNNEDEAIEWLKRK
jgi:antitoxin MazE